VQVVKGPVTKLLPADCRRIAFSRTADTLVQLSNFAKDGTDERTPVFVVGAFAHGILEAAYVDEWIAVSQYPLSAACCISKITAAYEDKWGIL
jgi:rRNA small subunit pseudouridine methyltransferase Nep1